MKIMTTLGGDSVFLHVDDVLYTFYPFSWMWIDKCVAWFYPIFAYVKKGREIFRSSVHDGSNREFAISLELACLAFSDFFHPSPNTRYLRISWGSF